MSTHLKKSLSPILLWGLGVGYVISGMYFGWNIGLDKGGTLGLGIATVFILIMYITFSLSYSELACAIPKAGGVFDYVGRAFGKDLGFVAGMAQWIEFVFAPPAIALGIGAYFHILYPAVDELVFAIVAYFIFTAINIIGVKISATFELIITIIAVAELSLFASLTLPHFQLQNLQTNPFPHGIEGIFAAIPFAIWFFLGMEGIANVAEETIDPQKNITKAFMYSMATLGLLAAMTFCAAVGVGGWEKVVYDSAGKVSDSPLPMALGQITGNSGLMYHMLVSVGLFGFVASFNGLLLAAGRVTYEFGKVGQFPRVLGEVHPKFNTPHWALVANMVLGIFALFTKRTGDIITLSVFGAITLYIFSCLAIIRLRKTEPDMPRPFRTPFYPVVPIIALTIASVALVAMSYFNIKLAIIYFAVITFAFVLYKLFNSSDKS
ncbi:MAG: ethanolamine permease [Chitinophagales bacterium]|jgi:ethanolamine permease|nr:ethanolamine permease [Chitinophagales bacterium]